MPSPSLRPTIFVGLVLSFLTAADCGGKIGSPVTVAPDASTPGGGCPSSETLYGLGAPCSWDGVCTLPVDVCANGQSTSIGAVCSGGVVAVAPGQDYACSGTSPTCPDPSFLGGSCDESGMTCPASSPECGVVDCTCEGGEWLCPSCGVAVDAGDDDGGEIDDAAPPFDAGGGPPDSGRTCYAPPGHLYAETSPGVFCPFSSVGTPNLTCAAGQECCVTPESSGAPSTCDAVGACPVAGSIAIPCEGTPDCAASNEICCGFGRIEMQAPQPGCGPGGTTTPAYPYVSGFAYGVSGVRGTGGTFCASTCAAASDAGPVPTFQVCSQTSECPSGQTCTAIAPNGVAIGYCAAADGSG